MKARILLSVLALVVAGCSPITNYQTLVKAPAPSSLQGVWQTDGAQSGLVSPDAVGYLFIDAEGNTLDCRQWQRVIAKPGKLSRIGGDLVNVNRQLRVMPLTLEGNSLHYDRLVLRKVPAASLACQQAQSQAEAKPNVDIIQNIDLGL